MRKVVQLMHVSLDGFVAGPNGEMDWINVDGELFDYAGQRTNESDLALYGRNTFNMMEGYWPTAADQPNASKHDREHAAWYNKVSKIVLSKSMKGQSLKNVTILSENIGEQIRKIKETAGKEIIIFGSPSATHSLMKEGLIDDIWLFVNPVILGNGIPVFKDVPARVELKLNKTHTLKSGVVCLHYQKI